MELRNIAKNTSYLAGSRVISFIIGIFRAKINALYLGTTGVGIVSQLQDTLNKFSSISTFGMESGCLKLIAEKKNNENNQDVLNVLKTYFILILPLTLLIYLGGLIFNEYLAKIFLGNASYKYYFLIAFTLFPFIVLRSIPSSILYGYKKISFIALSEIIISVLMFIIYIILVLKFDILGVVINLSLTILVTFVVFAYYAFFKVLRSNGFGIKDILIAKISRTYSYEILAIGGIGMILGYFEIACDAASRAYLINSVGIGEFGLYSPIIAWSGLFAGFIYPSISGYLFPRFTEAKSDIEVTEVANDVLRLMTFTVIPFVFLGIAFRSIIIPLFYSSQFARAADYLPLHFISILFGTWIYVFTLIFTPTGRIKKYIPFGLGHNTFSLLLVLILTPLIGLWAWALKYFITYIILSIILLIYFQKEINFKFRSNNLSLIIYSIAGSVIISIIPSKNILLFSVSLILTGSTIFFTKKNERAFLISKIPFINKNN
ncbi:MAG: oligosaccharide flippase family protein [Ignavibacteriales bacterium]|nr:oligosaccharide flippase family protein [Ignavibacteriales bacterium]